MFQLLPAHENGICGGGPFKSQLIDVEHKLYMGLELTEDDRQLLLRSIQYARADEYNKYNWRERKSYENK